MEFATLLLKDTRAVESISFVVVKADLLTEKEKDSSLGRPHMTPPPYWPVYWLQDLATAVIPSSTQASQLWEYPAL